MIFTKPLAGVLAAAAALLLPVALPVVAPGHGDPKLTTLEGHPGEVWHVVFSPDGRGPVATGKDSTVRP